MILSSFTSYVWPNGRNVLLGGVTWSEQKVINWPFNSNKTRRYSDAKHEYEQFSFIFASCESRFSIFLESVCLLEQKFQYKCRRLSAFPCKRCQPPSFSTAQIRSLHCRASLAASCWLSQNQKSNSRTSNSTLSCACRWLNKSIYILNVLCLLCVCWLHHLSQFVFAQSLPGVIIHE